MSLIKCLGDCKYQRDGYCELESVFNWQGSVGGNDCIYHMDTETKNSLESSGDGLGNISD